MDAKARDCHFNLDLPKIKSILGLLWLVPDLPDANVLKIANAFPVVYFKIQEHHRPSDQVGWPMVLLDFEQDTGKAISVKKGILEVE
jgi:hypothetical protein